jgi:hypothetical protein
MPTFKTTLHGVQDMNATGIEIPAEVIDALGAGKRPKIVVTVAGVSYRSTAMVMGGRYMLGVTQEQRAKTGLKAGDPIEVTIELDTAPREVTVPPDLEAALKAAGVLEVFEKLSYTHRKEHVRAIEEAKAAETRQRRIDKAVAMVSAKA